VDPVVNERLLKDFTGENDGFVQVGPKKYVFPSTFRKHAENLYNFKARSNDIWIASFARAGTTLTQELVWLVANDLDYETAQREFLTKRSPMLEYCIHMHDKTTQMFLDENKGNAKHQEIIKSLSNPGYEFISNISGQRFIKTHLPFSLLPPSVMNEQAKVIYVARNPKDLIVSYYHLCRAVRFIGYDNDFETFLEYFENDLVVWSPYWEHVKEYWNHRHDPNFLFLFYEEMTKDLPAVIAKVAKFLNKEMNEKQIMKLTDHLNIENFRKNPSVNRQHIRGMGFYNTNEPPFVRKGISSGTGWPKEYTPQLIERIENWIAKNLADTTLRFPELS